MACNLTVPKYEIHRKNVFCCLNDSFELETIQCTEDVRREMSKMECKSLSIFPKSVFSNWWFTPVGKQLKTCRLRTKFLPADAALEFGGKKNSLKTPILSSDRRSAATLGFQTRRRSDEREIVLLHSIKWKHDSLMRSFTQALTAHCAVVHHTRRLEEPLLIGTLTNHVMKSYSDQW